MILPNQTVLLLLSFSILKTILSLLSFFCRDHRLVNWDCTLRTAISDIEVMPECSRASDLY